MAYLGAIAALCAGTAVTVPAPGPLAAPPPSVRIEQPAVIDRRPPWGRDDL